MNQSVIEFINTSTSEFTPNVLSVTPPFLSTDSISSLPSTMMHFIDGDDGLHHQCQHQHQHHRCGDSFSENQSYYGQANNASSLGISNNSATVTYRSAVKQPTHMIVVYAVAYAVIFIAALVGNAMVVAVVMLRPGMRSVTNLFIANLAVANMLVALFCIPITFLDNIYYGWPFGAALCKLTPYMQGVTVCASVYNLAVIAVDRYIAICFRPQFRIMRRGACIALAGIWIFSFALLSPWLVYYQHFTSAEDKFCQAHWPNFKAQKAFHLTVIFMGTYLLPLLVIFLCYILIARKVWQRRAPGVAIGYNVIKRYKMKVIKMLLTVVTVFALSWLPLHLIYLIVYFQLFTDQQVYKNITDIGVPLAQWLELSNSGMNAFIYCFFSENFRQGFVDMFRCVFRRQITEKRDSLIIFPSKHRFRRSLSEESTMLATCVTNASARWPDRRGRPQTCPLEKRYVWNARCNGTRRVVSCSHCEVSCIHKWPRIVEISNDGLNIDNNPI